MCAWFTLAQFCWGQSQPSKPKFVYIYPSLLSGSNHTLLCLIIFFFRKQLLYLLILQSLENVVDMMFHIHQNELTDFSRYQVNILLTFAEWSKVLYFYSCKKQKLVQNCLFIPVFAFCSTTVYQTYDLKGVNPGAK